MKLTFIEGRLFEGEHRADALHIQTDLPAGFSVRIAFLTPKGRRVETEDLTLTDGEGDYEVPQSLLDGAGVLLGQLIAVSDDRVLKSEIFPFDVERSLPDDVSDAPDGVFYTLKGVAKRLDALEGAIGDLVTDAEFHSYVDSALSNKQDTLVFDSTPTAGSTNPVTSGGIKSFVEGKGYLTEHRTLTVTGDLDVSTLEISNLSAPFSTALDAESVELQLNYIPHGSSRPKQIVCALVERRRFASPADNANRLIFAAVAPSDFVTYMNVLPFLEFVWGPDAAEGTNAAGQLFFLQQRLTFDSTPTTNSPNPVISGGIKSFVEGKGYLTEHRTLTVTGDFNVTSLGITNLSASLNSALSAESVELKLKYHPLDNYSREYCLTCMLVDRLQPGTLRFAAILPTGFANRDSRPLFLDINWGPQSGAVHATLRPLQPPLTFDSEPTEGSTKLVRSGGIKTYVDTSINDAISSVWDENPVLGYGVSSIQKAYAEEPASPQEGDVWYDTTGTDPLVRYYDGTNWDECEAPDNMALYILI